MFQSDYCNSDLRIYQKLPLQWNTSHFHLWQSHWRLSSLLSHFRHSVLPKTVRYPVLLRCKCNRHIYIVSYLPSQMILLRHTPHSEYPVKSRNRLPGHYHTATPNAHLNAATQDTVLRDIPDLHSGYCDCLHTVSYTQATMPHLQSDLHSCWHLHHAWFYSRFWIRC